MKLVATAVLLAGTYALGQTTNKTKIYVDCTCNDIVGMQYAMALRDTIASSSRYELASSSLDGTGKDAVYHWALSIVSINDLKEHPGVSTAVSIVLNLGGIMLSQHILSCGAEMVRSCASSTLASADNDIQQLARK